MYKKKSFLENIFFKKNKIRFVPTFVLIFFFIYIAYIFGQPILKDYDQITNKHQTEQQFIEMLVPYSKQMNMQYGVLPSINIAQAILESDWGSSELSKQYNNYYGVKTFAPYGIVMETKEYINGEWHTVNGRFAIYSNWKESMLAHTKLFINGTSWNPKQYTHVLNSKNYTDAAHALVLDGYATDPKYAEKIIDIIEKYKLNKYDN